MVQPGEEAALVDLCDLSNYCKLEYVNGGGLEGNVDLQSFS